MYIGLGAREAKGDVWLLGGGKVRSQVVEGPVGCGKEHSLNLTSEPPPFLVPKTRFSLQPLGRGGGAGPAVGGEASKAEQCHRLDNFSITSCSHPPQGGSQL